MSINEKQLKSILDTALEAAAGCTGIMMNHWRAYRGQGNSGMPYTAKKDLTPVTELDRQVEQNIRAVISKKYPGHQILGEEFGEDTDKTSPFLWIIDPIDGTKAFIRGLPNFATQIAVMHEGKIIAAVSNAPALNETLAAYKNGGAFLNNKKIQVSRINSVKESYICHGNVKYFNRLNKLPQLLDLFENAWCVRGLGDFLGYHLLARGSVDAMLEAAVKIWDVAALSLIVEEAGGKVTDIHGKPVSLDTTTIAATNGRIHDDVLAFLVAVASGGPSGSRFL
jgi:histidinol-phosphatase